jgi:hypothetical protein
VQENEKSTRESHFFFMEITKNVEKGYTGRRAVTPAACHPGGVSRRRERKVKDLGRCAKQAVRKYLN